MRKKGIPYRILEFKTRVRAEEGKILHEQLAGWRISICLNKDKRPEDAGPDVWFFSAQLLNPQASTVADWDNLGVITKAAGAPDEPVTPLDKAAPGAVHHWLWTEEKRSVRPS